MCAHDLEGEIYCTQCYARGVQQIVKESKGKLVGVWVCVGIFAAIGLLISFLAIQQTGAQGAGILVIVPFLAAYGWCVFWGWPPYLAQVPPDVRRLGLLWHLDLFDTGGRVYL
jgi:hypothetical protein